ncbi:MAG: hypothetical protein CMN30_25465 [Sandaracinus sp.]|nr:hypothetical protein [Sandaracinus sp.]|tara:strand:+ start:572 stop:1780 length:1209 start_codon:yes stop_codon:yes gene_type:complete
MMRAVLALRSWMVVAALGASASAHAQCPTRTLATGISLSTCATHAVAIVDLGSDDVALRGARSSERGRSASAWAGSVDGAAFAVQAGPFSFPSFTPRGLTVGAGEHWSETVDDGTLAVLGFDGRGVGVFVPADRQVPAEPWQETVVSGIPVVRDGVALACHDGGCQPMPRTGMGLSSDGRRLVVVVARAVTDAELGALMAEAGVRDGLRSGSGATSALWDETGDEWVVPSSDGEGRAGAAWLAAVDRSTGEQFRLRGVVGVAGEERFLPDATVTVESVGGEEVASGMPITEGAYWEYRLPVREYVVRAARSGYRTGCKICVGVPGEDVWCSVFLSEGSGAETCTPAPRTLEVGPYAAAPTTPDMGPGSVPVDRDDGGCAAGGASARGWAALALLGLGLRRRR